jgi:hypothetical protein
VAVFPEHTVVPGTESVGVLLTNTCTVWLPTQELALPFIVYTVVDAGETESVFEVGEPGTFHV